MKLILRRVVHPGAAERQLAAAHGGEDVGSLRQHGDVCTRAVALQAARDGIGPDAWRNYSSFIAKLDDAIERCVASIVEATPKAVKAQKRLMRRWERLSIDEGIQAGIDAMAQSVADGEHLERMTAFVNRKKG